MTIDETPEKVTTDEEPSGEAAPEDVAGEVAADEAPPDEVTGEVAADEAPPDEVAGEVGGEEVTVETTVEAKVEEVATEAVVTVEDKQLRDYELTLVISPEVTDEQFEGVLANVSRLVTTREGVVSDTEQWGKRSLAYPIGHFIEGNYVLTKLKLKPGSGKELEANLKISKEVLRHLLIKLDS